jgi:hypothetical protein
MKKNVSFPLQEDIYRQLKKLCIQRRITIKEFFEDFVEKSIDSFDKKPDEFSSKKEDSMGRYYIRLPMALHSKIKEYCVDKDIYVEYLLGSVVKCIMEEII